MCASEFGRNPREKGRRFAASSLDRTWRRGQHVDRRLGGSIFVGADGVEIIQERAHACADIVDRDEGDVKVADVQGQSRTAPP